MSLVVYHKEQFLGPLLFLIFINNLPESISSSCSLFADDCLLYRKIETDNDCRVLQQDLYNVEMWAKKMANGI